VGEGTEIRCVVNEYVHWSQRIPVRPDHGLDVGRIGYIRRLRQRLATRPGAGPPPHIHHREDESSYVIEGQYEFLIKGRIIRVEAGSLLYFPKGTLHAHRGVGEGVGRMLVTQTPGDLYERFFEVVGRPVEVEAGPSFFEKQPDVRR
jgi:mannose-6-phosphate isomerase-like protein (cupin superfamily)